MILIFWLGCSLPTNKESLELVCLLDNGQVFESRFTKGDTGLYKGQAHLRANRWSMQGTPMSFHLDVPPPVSEISKEGAVFWGQRLYMQNDIWQVHIRSEEYNVSGQLPKSNSSIYLHAEEWNIDVLQPNGTIMGWSSAMGRSGLLKGNCALFHRQGQAQLQDDRHTILAFGTDNYVGIEHNHLIQQSWGVINGQKMRDKQIMLSTTPTHIEGSISEQSYQFQPSTHLGQEDLYDHLTSVERNIGSLVMSQSNRHITYGTMTIQDVTLPAIHIYYGNKPFILRKNE